VSFSPVRLAKVVALLLLMSAADVNAQTATPGKRAPDINLPTLTGGRFDLSKLRGNAVVVSFWGTWCPPCRKEFPELVRVQAEHGQAGLRVVAVNGRDQEESIDDVERFVSAFAVTFPVALDKRGSVRRAYRIVGQPTTVFIDSSGVVRKVHVGLIERDELDKGIAMILPPAG
jgi:peroxiredoxin